MKYQGKEFQSAFYPRAILRLAALALLVLAAACASPRKPAEPALDPSITPLTVEQDEQTRWGG